MAYSGQCLTSESLGGRSANRGQCIQACRLPYDLICDEQDVDLGDVKYLLSPQDLAAYALVPEMIDAGVSSFKIEGRLKTPEYVANITRQYRRALDAAVAGREAGFTERDVTEMELSFSRGFSPGWLGGCDHKMLVPGLSSAKRGVLVGRSAVSRGRSAVIVAARPFDCSWRRRCVYGDREEGTSRAGVVICGSSLAGASCLNSLGVGPVRFFSAETWDKQLWKTDDPQAYVAVAEIVHGFEAEQRRVGLDLVVRNSGWGDVCESRVRAVNGARCEGLKLGNRWWRRRKHPLTQSEWLAEQLGRAWRDGL